MVMYYSVYPAVTIFWVRIYGPTYDRINIRLQWIKCLGKVKFWYAFVFGGDLSHVTTNQFWSTSYEFVAELLNQKWIKSKVQVELMLLSSNVKLCHQHIPSTRFVTNMESTVMILFLTCESFSKLIDSVFG